MRMLSVLLFTGVLFGAAGTARAQAQPQATKKTPGVAELETRLDALAAEIEDMKRLAAESATLTQAVADLGAQVQSLRQDVDRLGRADAAQADLVARVDALDARVRDLAERVASNEAQVQAFGAPEAHAAAPAAGGPGGAYEDGFVLVRTPPFTLNMRGYAQLRYTVRTPEAELDTVNESGFLMRRARVSWDGTIYTPRLGYRVQLDFGQGRAELLDYYVDGKLPHGFTIRGGQFKVPFSRSFLNSAEALSFVERSVATEEFRYDRDLGVIVTWSGLGKRLELTLGLLNGAGRNVRGNDNIDPLLVARASAGVLGMPWKPEEGDPDHTARPGLVVGAGFTFENAPAPQTYDDGRVTVELGDPDVDGDGRRDNVRVVQVGVDASFRWRGLGIEAEAYARKEQWAALEDLFQEGAPDENLVGGFVQASYFVIPRHVQVGVRGAWTELSGLTIGGRRRASAPRGDTRRELSVLAAYYRYRHGIELSAMWSFLDWGFEGEDDPRGAGEQRFILEAQVGF